ncbi:putative serine carboxypeptidase CPVL [Labeo rohita]|uniref:Probable serine carboxypeptidase CPVL n=1 Tax=Labeo rohita TaxID=84645 RepID=A0A498NPD7_LABRO|nr:putative serine carboxypeptidase CPVL [Labeo rohita]
MLKETLRLLLLCAVLESVSSRGCSSFFCRKSHRVSGSRFGVDPGKPLMLTPYLEAGKIEEAKKLSLVGPLPGADVKSYSGYLTVNKTYNSNLFFWFFPAQERPETAPVLLWLEGGPGSSSLFSLFVEHGPYFVHKNLTLGYRDFPWTSRYSVLYIDNPVGTGWSFTEDDRGFAQNQDDVGRDLYSALTQFFQIFSEFQSNPFYATGESYAGKYVPAIGYYIHKNNPSAEVKINFTGVAIGDGLCDPELMLGGYADFLYQSGLVDELQKQHVQSQMDAVVKLIQEQKWVEAFEVFDRVLSGDLVPYPSYFQNVTGCTNYLNYVQCQEPPDLEYFSAFVTLPDVRRSIHVGNLTFHDGSDVEKYLLQDVLIYSGQLDVIVAATLTERFLPTVNWSRADEYKKAERFHWKVRPSDTEVAGYVRQVGELFQVIVRGGGHILPYDQPERSFDMIDRFLSKDGFSSHRYTKLKSNVK